MSEKNEGLEKLLEAFATMRKLFAMRDIVRLKHLGAEAARQALEFNEPRFVEMSVVSYSLSKLLEKPYIVESNRWKKFSIFLNDQLSAGLKCKTEAECDAVVSSILHEVEKLSFDLGRFVTSVIEKARVKAATQIYAHGASVGRAMELTGADRKELLNYIGATKLPDKYVTKTVKERMELAVKLFK